MAEGYYQLTYRDLADRLGISPDAARMKANRKAKAGLWRFLPDDGPGQERRVEIPAADLEALPVRRAKPDVPEAPERIPTTDQAEAAGSVATAERPAAGEHVLPAEQPAEPNVQAEQASEAEHSVVAEPSPAPEQPAAAEHPVVVPISRPDAAEPVAERSGEQAVLSTEDAGLGSDSADPLVKTLAARVSNLTDRLLGEIQGREKDHAELEASQAREEMLKVEIERLCNRVSELTNQLDQTRRPWWRGIMPGSSGDNR